jgi:hypothetical protein
MTRWRRERGVPPPTSPRRPRNRGKEPAGTCERHWRRRPHDPRAAPHIPTYRRRPPEEGTRATKAPAWSDLAVDSHSRPPPPTPAASQPGGGGAGRPAPPLQGKVLPATPHRAKRREIPAAPFTGAADLSGSHLWGRRGKEDGGRGGRRRGARVLPPGRLEGRREGVQRKFRLTLSPSFSSALEP